MMLYKVITIALITICAAEHPKLLSQLLSNQRVALTSQAIWKHVLFPMVLKYDKVDTKVRFIRSAHPNSMYQKLQYAPLRKGLRDFTNPTPTHSSAPVEPTEWLRSKNNKQYGKAHLEPRTEATDKKCYAPDYKPKAKPSASRSPGHNAVYRMISEPKVKAKPVQVKDYDKPIGINLDFKFNDLKSTSTTDMPLIELTSDDKHKPLTLTKEHFVISPNSLETDLPVQEKSKRYSSHPKFHRLHLNIARVYSPGQVPPKVPVYARAYPEHFGMPPKPKAYMPQAYQDQNTLLFPVKHTHHRKGNYRARTSILHF